MKKKIVSLVLTISIVLSAGIKVSATPLTDEQEKQKVEQSKKLDDVNSKIKELRTQVDELTDKLEVIYSEIEKNNTEIDKSKNEMKDTQKYIDKLKTELKEKETVLGSRLKAVYKTGGIENYLGVILSAQSVGDLISKVQAVEKVVNLDNKIIDDLNSKKGELDTKIKKLNSKNEELNKLNIANKSKMDDFNKKKDEQKTAIGKLNEEKSKIEVDLATVERPMVQPLLDIVKNSNSSINDLRSSIDALRNIRTQIKSPSIEAEVVNAIESAKTIVQQNENAEKLSRGASGDANANALLSYASQFVGRRYVTGGNGPDQFDCSGFTSYVFGHFGYGLTRTTYTQINQGTPISFDQLKPGDLVFERGSASAPGHVAIYWGNGQVIHAANPSEGVTIGPIYHYVAARRILK